MKEIDDGYTRDGYIAGQDGVFESLSFRYRPVSPVDERRLAVKTANLFNEKGRSDEEKAIEVEYLTFDMILNHIGWWNLTDSEGQPIAKDRNAMLAFPGIRYARLSQIVRDGLASDPRPDETQPAKTLEELEKNLPTASG